MNKTNDRAHRYFKIQGESQHYDDWGGDPTYWFEINDHGDAIRQIEEYPNGNTLSYDSLHEKDDLGGLCIMVVERGDLFWNEYEIS